MRRNPRIRVTVALAAAAAVTGFTAAAGVREQDSVCDPYLRQVSAENPLGYRVRGDRCEGLFVQPVANTPLVIASFGQIDLPDSLPAAGSMLLEWASIAQPVRLRASALTPKTYYRMDGRRPARAVSYSWPTDVLSALHLAGSEIGVVAWTTRTVGKLERVVYVPLRAGHRAEQDGTYDLFVIPGSELTEVFVGLSSVDHDGARVREIYKPRPLKYRFYPAGRVIRIPVGPLPAPGEYILDIGGTLRDGGAISDEVWFVHSPHPPRDRG